LKIKKLLLIINFIFLNIFSYKPKLSDLKKLGPVTKKEITLLRCGKAYYDKGLFNFHEHTHSNSLNKIAALIACLQKYDPEFTDIINNLNLEKIKISKEEDPDGKKLTKIALNFIKQARTQIKTQQKN